MIASDNDTDDKFFTSINDTGEKLSPVTIVLIQYFIERGSCSSAEKGKRGKLLLRGGCLLEQVSNLLTCGHTHLLGSPPSPPPPRPRSPMHGKTQQ